MKAKQYNHDLSVLVLTPTGKDADLVCQFIKQAGLNSSRCENLKELTGQIMNSQGPAVIAEEALNDTSQTGEFIPGRATPNGCARHEYIWGCDLPALPSDIGKL